MICQAYTNNKHDVEFSSQYESSYQIQTESYDYRMYQSHDTDLMANRGFQYNMSINDNQSEKREPINLSEVKDSVA